MEEQAVESKEVVEIVELSLEEIAQVGGGYGSLTLL
jgi:hypothetical protein